jgi:hypothetical protein
MEVASTMCGGMTALNNAIQRGDVVKQGPLYFFPTTSSAERQKLSVEETSTREREVVTSTHEALRGLVQKMGWAIEGDVAGSSGDGGDAPLTQAELVDRLTKIHVDLQKACRAAERQLDAVLQAGGMSDFIQGVCTAAQEAVEQATACVQDLKWVQKFRKHRDGQELCMDSAVALQTRAAKHLGDLSDQWRALKACNRAGPPQPAPQA